MAARRRTQGYGGANRSGEVLLVTLIVGHRNLGKERQIGGAVIQR
jgi:hypothetical protein